VIWLGWATSPIHMALCDQLRGNRAKRTDHRAILQETQPSSHTCLFLNCSPVHRSCFPSCYDLLSSAVSVSCCILFKQSWSPCNEWLANHAIKTPLTHSTLQQLDPGVRASSDISTIPHPTLFASRTLLQPLTQPSPQSSLQPTPFSISTPH
jgi:hypothetical protein